jgi:hypothetical protein
VSEAFKVLTAPPGFDFGSMFGGGGGGMPGGMGDLSELFEMFFKTMDEDGDEEGGMPGMPFGAAGAGVFQAFMRGMEKGGGGGGGASSPPRDRETERPRRGATGGNEWRESRGRHYRAREL